jgi:hypothetical protein
MDHSPRVTSPFSNVECASHLLPNLEMRAKFVSEIIKGREIGAEIGVHKGQFSRFLIDTISPQRLHLIDPWYLMGKEWDWAQDQKSTIFALTNIIREFEKELISQQVILHIGYDFDVLPSFPDSYFDWVYLDTSHSYEHTLLELELISNKLKPTGVIVGDDWYPDPSQLHHGVFRAVKDFLSKNQDFKEVYSSPKDKQWALAKKI